MLRLINKYHLNDVVTTDYVIITDNVITDNSN